MTSDGTKLKFLNRFERLVTVLHLVLFRGQQGLRDERALSTGQPGGSVSIDALQGSHIAAVPALTFGQLGQTVQAPAKGGKGAISHVAASALYAFLGDAGSALLGARPEGAFVLAGNPGYRVLGRLFSRFDGRDGYPDFRLFVSPDSDRFWNNEQRNSVKTFCGASPVEICLGQAAVSQFELTLRLHQKLCGVASGQCVGRNLFIADVASLPDGPDGLVRMRGRDGKDGDVSMTSLVAP